MKLQKKTSTLCENMGDAAALLWRSINIAGSDPAAAEYRGFFVFSRLDWAKKDDGSFRSGFAVRKGTGEIYRWAVTQDCQSSGVKPGIRILTRLCQS